MGNKYFAFISYSHKDKEWAKWIQHEFENFHLPEKLKKQGNIIPEFKPIFRDEDDLATGHLPELLQSALDSSTYLIVICSKNLVESQYWVNQEIAYFKNRNNDVNSNIEKIFPLIIDGNSKEDFSPDELLMLSENEERLGANINGKGGRDKAFIKVVAGILKVDLCELWDRYEYEKIENERIERENKEKLQKAYNRVIAAKATELINKGNSYLAGIIIKQALNSDMKLWIPEVEGALRKFIFYDSNMIESENKIKYATISDDDKYITITTNQSAKIYSFWQGEFIKDVSQISKGLFYSHKYIYINDEDLLRFAEYGIEIIRPFSQVPLVERSWKLKEFILDGKKCIDKARHIVIDRENKRAIISTAVFGYKYRINRIYIVDLKTLKTIKRFDEHQVPLYNQIRSISYSPLHKELLILLSQNRCLQLNISSGIFKDIDCVGTRIIQFNNKGDRILKIQEDGTIYIIEGDRNDNKCLQIDCGRNDILTACFSKDDNLITVGTGLKRGNKDAYIYVYDSYTGSLEAMYQCKGEVKHIETNTSCTHLLVINSDNKVQTFKLNVSQNITNLKCGNFHVTALALDKDGKQIAISTHLSGEPPFIRLQIVNARTLNPIRDYRTNMWNNEKIFFFSNDEVVLFNRDEIRIFDISKELTTLIKINGGEIMYICNSKYLLTYKDLYDDETFLHGCIIISKMEEVKAIQVNCNTNNFAVCDKLYILVITEGDSVKAIDIHTGKLIQKIGNINDIIIDRNSCFTPNGKYFVSNISKKSIGIWETSSWKQIATLDLQNEEIYSSYSLNNDYLICGTFEGEIHVWDIRTGIFMYSIDIQKHIRLLKFNSKNKSIIILTSDEEIFVYPWLNRRQIESVVNKKFKNRKLSEKEQSFLNLFKL
jgi:WD40 repeat protein